MGRSKLIEDHYNKIYVSECSECKDPMTEYQWKITTHDSHEIPGVCPMCVEKIIKKSMGIEDDDSCYDEYYRL